MNLPLAIIPEASLTPALDAEIRAFLCRCFPADATAFSQTRHWHGSAPEYSIVCRSGDGVLAGHIGIVMRTIRAGSEQIVVAGVQNMAVAPEQRGSGVGQAVMKKAMEEARRRGIEAGLLFCVPELAAYYARSGWRSHDVAACMNYEGRQNIPIPGKNICMVQELAGKPFPIGPIHLQGPDW